MNKTIASYLIIYFFLGISVISCGKEIEPPAKTIKITFSAENLTFNATQESQELKVTSNAEWGVSSNQDWCTCSVSGGLIGENKIQIKVSDNASEDNRTATLTFKSGSYSKQYSITQKGLVKIVSIPDANFKVYCVTNLDTDKDGEISEKEIRDVKSLDVSSKSISSLVGIEKFIGLTSLNCKNNTISTIDISTLKLLESFNCANNQLVNVNIRSNFNLKSFDSSGNSLLTQIYVWTGFNPTSTFIKPVAAVYVEPEIATPIGYTLVWQDEFNDSRINGKTPLPNTEKWSYETGAGGWGNNEIQNYIAANRGTDTCAIISDGILKIIAKKVGNEVLSIRMNTKSSWTYGYFEARLKMSSGKGTWPAFWMMPKNFTAWPLDGEIDIMEYVGYNPNVTHSSVHTQSYNHSIGTQKTGTKTISNAETTFHVYALEWTPDKITGYVDNVAYFTFANDGKNDYNTWPFYKPFYIKLNLAWGGNWGGAQGIDETKLPAKYEIDYVRVFQK